MNFAKKLGLVAVLSLSWIGCDKLNKADKAMDAASSIPESMERTNAEIAKTNDSVREQALKLAKDDMFSEFAKTQLSPVPTGVMAGARAFGKYANTTELVEFNYLGLTAIDKIDPLKNFDQDGNEIPLNLADKNRDLREKFHLFQALSAIAGLAPQEKVAAIVKDHIQTNEPSRFRKSALQFLMLRAYFIRGSLLQEGLLNKDFESLGSAVEASKLMRYMDYIVSLPFASQIAVKTAGLKASPSFSQIQNVDLKMDLETKLVFVSPWSEIANQLEKIVQVSMRSDSGDPARDQEIFNGEQETHSKLLNESKSRADFWKNTLK